MSFYSKNVAKFFEIVDNRCKKTRQGYTSRSTLKPAGYFFLRPEMEFNKPFQSIQQQIDLLSSRGMIIDDHAEHYLQHLNYYRLSGYWLPFQENGKERSHLFLKNTKFSDILNLYIFDRELRLLLLDAIERIEISIRTQWAYCFSECHGPHAYLQKDLNNIKWQPRNMILLEKELERSDEIFIKHYKKTYTSPIMPPIWAVCEIMSFGLLSRFLKAMRASETRTRIGKIYNLDYTVLVSFIEHLTYLRNLCAHHSRVWNKKLTKTMQIPISKPDVLVGNFNREISSLRKIYNSLVMIIYFLEKVCPDSHFKVKLVQLINAHKIDVSAMGFPNNWRDKPIWK